MFENFVLNFFSDPQGGLHIIGRKIQKQPIVVAATQETQQAKIQQPEIIGQDEFKEFFSPNICARKVEEEEREADDLYRLTVIKQKEIVDLKRNIAKTKLMAEICTKINFVVGFVLGIWLSVAEMLQLHGPTVTHLGTIVASLLYVAMGYGLGKGTSWLVSQEFDSKLLRKEEKLQQLEEERTALLENRKKSLENVKKFSKKVFLG